MKFDWENWNPGGKIIFVAACAAAASMFMNWVDVGIASRIGLAQSTFFLLSLWVYPVLMLFKNQDINRNIGLGCAIGSAVLTLIYIFSNSVEMFNNSINASGSGAYLFLIASIVLIFGINKYKSI